MCAGLGEAERGTAVTLLARGVGAGGGEAEGALRFRCLCKALVFVGGTKREAKRGDTKSKRHVCCVTTAVIVVDWVCCLLRLCPWHLPDRAVRV